MLISKGIDHNFVLDQMSPYEFQAILTSLNNEYKQDLEFKRWQTYIQVCTVTDKVKSPKALLKFSWENEPVGEQNNSITPQEIEKRKQRMLKMINKS